MAERKYYTADITFCASQNCTNRSCERHRSNIDPMSGCGYFSVSDYSNNCPDFRGRKAKENADAV